MHHYYSQQGVILRAFKNHPGIRLTVSFFQSRPYFVGYKAWTRLCELVKEWLLVKSDFDIIREDGQKIAQYVITQKWEDFKLVMPTILDRIKHFLWFKH